MINAEWDIPITLLTPRGNLPFNDLVKIGSGGGLNDLGYIILDSAQCHIGVARRVTRTNIAQAGGEITHRKFKTGYVTELTGGLWKGSGRSDNGTLCGSDPLCGGDLRAMCDYISLCLNSIDNADGELIWTPSERVGETILTRALQPVRLLGPSGDGSTGFVSVVVTRAEGSKLVEVTFALLSPLPYGIDAAQTTTPLVDGVPLTIHNGGNADYYPVVWVNGPTNNFLLKNNSNLDEQGDPVQINYVGTANPGGLAVAGGHFIEFLMFQNTAYLDRNSTNMKPGINVPDSDFWTLVPGDNEIVLTGASGSIFWQNAYA